MRLIEQLAGAVGVVLVSPILGLLALAVMLESRGPVFVRHSGIGRNGQPVSLLKYRTTCHDRPARAGFRTRQRMTLVGAFLYRTRLENLPCLISLTKGDMSLLDDTRIDPRLF